MLGLDAAATVDVATQRLGVYPDGVLVDEHEYHLR